MEPGALIDARRRRTEVLGEIWASSSGLRPRAGMYDAKDQQATRHCFLTRRRSLTRWKSDRASEGEPRPGARGTESITAG